MLKLFKSLFGSGVPVQAETQKPSESGSLSTTAAHKPASEPEPEPIQEMAPQQLVSPEPPPVVSAPKPPSEHEEGELLRGTTQWQQEVQAGKQAWDDKMRVLEERWAALQEEGKSGRMDSALVLMLLAAYYYLDFSGPQVFETTFTQQLRARIERDLAVDGYRKFIAEKTRTRWNSYPRSVDYYVEEFERLRPCFLDGFLRMIELIPQMMDVTDGLIDQITQYERSPGAIRGGVMAPQFRGFLSRLAQEQLPAVRPIDFFPESVPRYIRDHYAGDIQTSGYLLLWSLYGVVRTRRRTQPTSTSQVGIEFEQRLMREICETFPDARIESTPVTGDQGADVVLMLQGVKIVIQAKRYTGVVGNAAVQEVYAAQQFYEADYAMVVTTSRYTTPAQALAQKIGVQLAHADDYLRRIQQMLV